MAISRWKLFRVSAAQDIIDRALDTFDFKPEKIPPTWHPLTTIASQVFTLNCKTVVQEYPYYDRDFASEHQAYYSRLFENIERYCRRFHFFSDEKASDAELSSPLLFVDRVAPETYLGYMTIRPVWSCPVGKTVIRPPKSCKFLTCKDVFRAELAGRVFTVEGMPFIQQDSAVGSCAQAALWMALRTQRKRHGREARSLLQISTAAMKHGISGRILPNRDGLAYTQVLGALSEIGYSTFYLRLKESIKSTMTPDDFARTKQLLYPYIESSVPVVLALYPISGSGEGHAVVLNGHGWPDSDTKICLKCKSARVKISRENEPDKILFEMFHPVAWASPFYVSNDNSGPYQELPDKESKGVPYALEQALYAFPIVHPDVFMTAEEAQVALNDFFGEMSELLDKEIGIKFIDQYLVVRQMLVSRQEFRKWSIALPSATLKEHYRSTPLPPVIWIFEFNVQKTYWNSGSSPNNKQTIRVGELLVDPSADPKHFPVIAFHLNAKHFNINSIGFLLIQTQDKSYDVKLLRDDSLYTPIVEEVTHCSYCDAILHS